MFRMGIPALGLAVAVIVPGLGQVQPAQPSPVGPYVQQHCVQCHGPAKQQGKLRLDTKEGAYAALKSGKHPIIPGKSGESRVILRAIAADPEERMPPPETGEPLNTLASL